MCVGEEMGKKDEDEGEEEEEDIEQLGHIVPVEVW